MNTIDVILSGASVIRGEDEVGMNTAERVGGEMYDIAEWTENMSPYDLSKETGADYYNIEEAVNAVPESVQKGGMILKFKQEDKYQCYFNTNNEWTTNIDYWKQVGNIDDKDFEKTGIDTANHTISLSGDSTTMTGYFTVDGNVAITSGLTVSKSINTTNGVNAMGPISAGDGLSVNGNTSLDGTLEVARSIAAGQGASISGNTSINGTLVVTHSITAGQGVSINGELQAASKINSNDNIYTKGSISSENGASVTGSTSIDGTLAVTRTITSGEGVSVTGNTSVNGNLTTKQLTVKENAVISGNTTIQNDLEVLGNFRLPGNTILDGSLGVIGDLSVSGRTSMAGPLSGTTIYLGYNNDVSFKIDVEPNQIVMREASERGLFQTFLSASGITHSYGGHGEGKISSVGWDKIIELCNWYANGNLPIADGNQILRYRIDGEGSGPITWSPTE